MKHSEQRALDVRIAEGIMGWEPVGDNAAFPLWRPPDGTTARARSNILLYSSNPTAASRVLDVLAEAGLCPLVTVQPGETAVTIVDFEMDHRGDAVAHGSPSEAWPEALALACTTDPVLSHMKAWRASREETTNAE